jgi:hypothetical protein
MRAPTRERMMRERMISIMAWGSTIMMLVISIGFLVPKAAAQSDKYSVPCDTFWPEMLVAWATSAFLGSKIVRLAICTGESPAGLQRSSRFEVRTLPSKCPQFPVTSSRTIEADAL